MPYYKKNIDKSSVCYLHRLGRIGRFGNKGLVINLITKHFDWVLLKKIKKKYKINIKKVT
jgi:superfamily II DNA/RNA helicase